MTLKFLDLKFLDLKFLDLKVIEGSQGEDHGVVICKLCQRHEKANNFAGDGYR